MTDKIIDINKNKKDSTEEIILRILKAVKRLNRFMEDLKHDKKDK